MKPFDLVGIGLPGLCDPRVPAAASRAGGIGILDLTGAAEPGRALAALSNLLTLGRGRLGIRLDPEETEMLAALAGDPPGRIDWVLLSAARAVTMQRAIETIRPWGARVAAEVISVDEARAAEGAGADLLVARGHEAGGRVGEETAFVLFQRLAGGKLPVWVQGGIGEHTVAACYAAGAAGVVLDSQLALTRESPLDEPVRQAIARMDGSETACIGSGPEGTFRIYLKPGCRAAESLREEAAGLLAAPDAGGAGERRPGWLARRIARRIAWGPPGTGIWPLGQEACFAADLAARHGTVGGVLQALRRSLDHHLRLARELRPLGSGSPLARSHGTIYPIVQGPMTRVSDTADFALEVARAGGLPFLALALLRAGDVGRLMERTRELLGDRPWGVGILGFVPLELRQEQLEVIRRHRPAFALIAGGRPDQAMALEKDGIPTYLHVPSPGLLRLFLENGSRRFVFEGRECGGHVGPRSSFVLWNSMIDVLLESLSGGELERCHVLFAGGVHDARSAAMVAAMAAPLAAKGVRIGVLMGTAYLFTREAVTSGAIVDGFQQEALRCKRTVLLETGPGHATRCSDTAFAAAFMTESRRLESEGRTPEERRVALEDLNLGRLRIASKGIRRGSGKAERRYEDVAEPEQHEHGMYMIGQVAAARSALCTIGDLHRDVSEGSSERLGAIEAPAPADRTASAQKPCDVAIIGMGCLLPRAESLHAYWENILGKVDAITEVPPDRWDWRRYYDPDPAARDRIYSRWGGFLADHPFDPMRYGMPPNTLPSIEPLQLLTLDVVRAALEDSGYLDRPHVRPRTSVVLGAGGGVADLGNKYGMRAGLPMLVEDVPEEILGALPEWTEDSFAGILLNVAAGRVANRFDLGGSNYTVDAACASSLAAVYLGIKELESGTSDLVIAGGADTVQNPFGYLCFSKTRALSPNGRCRTFDAEADGIVISEGLAAVVLKRLADAERDGDRIYAVIKGIASSSDGRDKGLTAPRREGQILALERAYAKAGFSPATVGLIEAHGTGTVAGDRAEVDALKSVFAAAGGRTQATAIGSVKSMIGHTKCTAGVAGMIKIALALHHKVLPPTLNVERPNPRADFPESPFYVNSETRPWIRAAGDPPRRAGVSAFGFGGTNFHAVLEEHTGEIPPVCRPAVIHHDRPELLLFRGASREEIATRVGEVEEAIAQGARPDAAQLAFSLWRRAREAGPDSLTLAILVEPGADLAARLAAARKHLAGEAAEINDPTGIYLSGAPLARQGSVAFLFPGQGSQYVGMLSDLAVHFPEARERFEAADAALSDRFPGGLSRLVFPPPSFGPEEKAARARALTETNVAQPALGAADTAMLRVLGIFGVRPGMAAGHSYGEYVALRAAGVFDDATLAILSESRGRSILEAAREDLGTMAAVPADRTLVESLIEGQEDLWIANLNAPLQTVVSGSRRGIDRLIEASTARGIEARLLPVACAFHSPLVAPARDRLAHVLASREFLPPEIPVYSNTTATPYPEDGRATETLLAEHLVNPVLFADEINAMHAAGARIFVEAGPKAVLTGLTRQTLDGKPHLAVCTDLPGRPGLVQLLHALGQLASHGVPVDLERLFAGRELREIGIENLVEETRAKPLPPTTWMVNGGRARPLRAAASEEAGAAQKARPAAAPAPPRLAPPVSAVSPPSASPSASLAATPAESAPSGMEDLLARHQGLMRRFLEVQHSVMLAALRGSDLPVAAGADLPAVAGPWPVPAGPPSPGAGRVVEPAAPAAAAAAGHSGAGEATPEPSGVAAAASRESLIETLRSLVSDRTGYPPEMLDLSVDMEADLGIDSIKRVEILGVMQKSCLAAPSQAQGRLEELNACRTLGSVVDWFEKALEAGAAEVAQDGAPSVTAPAPASEHAGEAGALPPRFELVAAAAPIPDPSAARPLPRSGAHLITGHDHDLAVALAGEIRREGGRVLVVCPPGGCASGGEVHVAIDTTTPGGAQAAVDAVRRDFGSVVALVHLATPGSGVAVESAGLDAWRRRLREDVKSFFHLARAAGPDLLSAGERGEGMLTAVTTLGGGFGLDGTIDEDPGGLPVSGGLAGLVKTLFLEWPSVRCRVVDTDGREPATARAGHLLSEIRSEDAEPEVGRRGETRFVLRARPAPAPDPESPARVRDGDVIVVTGGARGITAESAIEIAAGSRPTFVLIGRSAPPSPEEPVELRGLESPREIKAALMESQRASGTEVSLPAVERAYAQLLKDREIRANLGRLRATGATVEYHAADVRDEVSFGTLLDGVYERHGRIDGVIHGAGIIEDRLLLDKEPDSFDRVFDTKTDSAFILARRLRPEGLGFLVFFASVSGPFGSRGQCDYAAANEVVNRLAARLSRAWPGRIVSINWGPWATTGMAGEEVQRQFRERGVQVLPLEAGRRAFARELAAGTGSEPAIVIGGGPWRIETAGRGVAARSGRVELPLLDGIGAGRGQGESVELLRTFDTLRDLYLTDHRLDGNPVVPAAVAMELMAEVAQRGWPDLQVTGLRDLQVLKGMIVDNGPREVRLAARAAVEPPHDRLGVDVSVEMTDPASPAHRYYRATLELSDRIPVPPPYTLPFESDLEPFGMEVPEAYRRYLFHGPLFQGIRKIQGVCRRGMVADLEPSSPARCLAGAPAGEWLIDPVVFDSGLQMVILWARTHLDVTPLPSRYRRYRRFAPLAGPGVRCDLHIQSQTSESLFYIDLLFTAPDGKLLGWLEGMECPSSRAFNRLAGGHLRSA